MNLFFWFFYEKHLEKLGRILLHEVEADIMF